MITRAKEAIMGGWAATEAAIDLQFQKAEQQGVCLVPSSRSLRRALAARASEDMLLSPLPGMFARPAYWNALSRPEKLLLVVRTDALLHPTWVFSHATAAFVLGLDVSYNLIWPINFLTDNPGGGKHPPHHKHHRTGYNAFIEKGSIKTTDVLQTVIDCARTYPFGHALAIADSALHQGLIAKDDLEAGLAWFGGKRGIRAARRVVSLADERPDSGGESMVRALMMELSLPQPILQAPVPNLEHPELVYRVDFLFRPEGLAPVAFELDGLEKYESIQMTKGRTAVRIMAEERQREAAITASGIRVVRLGFRQAMKPRLLLAKLAAYGVVPTS